MPRPRRATPPARNRRNRETQAHGNSSRRQPADAAGTEGIFHRHGAAGSDYPDRSARAARLDPGFVRARRAHGVAYASTWADPLRDLGDWPRAGQGWTGARNPPG